MFLVICEYINAIRVPNVNIFFWGGGVTACQLSTFLLLVMDWGRGMWRFLIWAGQRVSVGKGSCKVWPAL